MTGHSLEPGNNWNMNGYDFVPKLNSFDHFTRIMAMVSEKLMSPLAKFLDTSKTMKLCGTIFESLRKEKSASK